MSGVGVGAGIDGLAANPAGHRDTRTFERVADLRPLGVGMNLLPYAVRELTELGLADPANEPGPHCFYDISEVFAPGEPADTAACCKRAAGSDPDTLDSRPSPTPTSVGR